jgi:hypothetical protein
MAVTTVTPSPVPANTASGGMPENMGHVTIVATGAGAFKFAHGLPYKPTCVLPIAQTAEGTAAVTCGWIPSDTDTTYVGVEASGAATIDVYFG